jgi:tetratricopeptide (TPR) repeat protein
MSKKKRKPLTPMQMEQDMKKLFDHLQDQKFSSLEEINAYLSTLSGKPLGEALPDRSGNESDQDKAQELVYQALEASSPLKATRLIEEALKLDPNNVDALNFKAENSGDIGLAIQYYQQAVEAGKQALGDEFEGYKGHFWGFHETRPFMRAKAGLAGALYFVGRFQEAIQHYWEMLELNPNDNQGIRYSLAALLLEHNDFQGYEKLHKLFADDGMAASLYNHALYLFKTEGGTPRSDKALKTALKQNRFVPAFLLGKKKIPEQLPDYYGFGDENEAISYVASSMLLWKKTPMALMWMTKHLRK